MKYSKDYGITETIVETTLRDFVSREVLTLKESVYMPHVRFFGKWLVEIGIGELINTLPIIDPVLAHKKEQEEATISSKEIVDLAGKWGNYRGRAITEDRIRAWLSQFGSPENQRLMFKMPLEISFYSRVFAVR